MGRGTSKNTEKAVKWLEMAAANNDLNGLFNLAQIYFQGSGVEVDYEKSANFIKKQPSSDITRLRQDWVKCILMARV